MIMPDRYHIDFMHLQSLLSKQPIIQSRLQWFY